MKKYVFVFSLVCSTVLHAQIYRSVDKDGNAVFSDVPTKDSVEIELREPTQVESLVKDPQPLARKPEKTSTPVFEYESLVITSPADDVAIRDNGGNITITVSVEPALRYNDLIVLYLDGAEHESSKSPTFNLTGLGRGTHTARVSIKDETGKILESSKTVTFHLLRHSALHKGTNNPAPQG